MFAHNCAITTWLAKLLLVSCISILFHLTADNTVCVWAASPSSKSIILIAHDEFSDPVRFTKVGFSFSSKLYKTDSLGNLRVFLPDTISKFSVTLSAIGFQRLTIKDIPATDTTIVCTLVAMHSIFENVVVTGNLDERKRRSEAIAVDILNEQVLSATNSLCLAEVLNFQSGVRVETDCQTCNYTQVRLNGLGGAYTQILINNRPIFSTLAGLYALEQIPAAMIDKVEVIRGGNSALYGSGAIAGVINILTKIPTENSASVSFNSSFLRQSIPEHSLNANGSLVSKNRDYGMTFFAQTASRREFDANGDGFSEIPRVKGTSFGTTAFLRTATNSSLQASVAVLQENRDGGDNLDKLPHERQQSEQRQSLTKSIDVAYQSFWENAQSSLQIFGGAQSTNRTHYTGSFGADGYGTTENTTLQCGIQFSRLLDVANKNFYTTIGSEAQSDYTFDEIPAYGYLINQRISTFGLYAQTEYSIWNSCLISAGLRLNAHSRIAGLIATPRLNLLWKISDQMQLRTGFGKGFRGPQAFDADMHIAFAGGGVSLIQIAPNLLPEFSNTYTISLDYKQIREEFQYETAVNFFASTLRNTFVLEEFGNDSSGNMILQRKNGSDAHVTGVSGEFRCAWEDVGEFELGCTFQSSFYDQAVSWSASVPAEKHFLRTPNVYGFAILALKLHENIQFSWSNTLTGSMLVPHFAGAPGVEHDQLISSKPFLEVGFKVQYFLPLLSSSQSKYSIHLGVKNLFDAYQRDFDTSATRDSNFIYGPARPRTLYAGFTWKL